MRTTYPRAITSACATDGDKGSRHKAARPISAWRISPLGRVRGRTAARLAPGSHLAQITAPTASYDDSTGGAAFNSNQPVGLPSPPASTVVSACNGASAILSPPHDPTRAPSAGAVRGRETFPRDSVVRALRREREAHPQGARA